LGLSQSALPIPGYREVNEIWSDAQSTTAEIITQTNTDVVAPLK
jgi:hypothetical protein